MDADFPVESEKKEKYKSMGLKPAVADLVADPVITLFEDFVMDFILSH